MPRTTYTDDYRESQRVKMNERRKSARDVVIGQVVNPARREACLADPAAFLSTYFPEVYFNPWTDSQLEIIRTVVESARFGTSQAIAEPRGNGKTKIVEGLVIYCVLAGLIRFPVIVASDAKASMRILGNLKWLLSDPRHLLGEDFPEVCDPIKALEGEPRRAPKQTVNGTPTNIGWSKEYLRLPTVAGSVASGAIIYPLSIEGGIRGLAMGAERPDFVMIDDPETRESAASSYQVGIREETIDRDIAGLKGPRGRIGMVALVTIQTSHSLAARLTDRTIKPAWNGIRRGMIASWPTRVDLWDEYMHRRKTAQENGDRFAKDATRFYLEHRAEMDEGAVVTNPHRFNRMPDPDGEPLEVSALQACYNFIADKGRDAFNCEYQNDPGANLEQLDVAKLTAKAVESRVSPLAQIELPSGCIGVTAAIDVGTYACHWAVTAWRPEGEGFIVDYGVAEVHGNDPGSSRQAVERSIRLALSAWHEEIACRVLTDPEGKQHTIGMTLVDTGDGPRTEAIYEWVKSLPSDPKVCASKGYGEGQGPRPRQFGRDARSAPRIDGQHWFAQLQPDKGVWLYHLDANFWKLWVHERFSCDLSPNGDPTPYSLSLFRSPKPRHHHSYARHITAEEWREEFVPGKGMRRGWHQLSKNNHWLDATYMACAAAGMLKLFTISERRRPVAIEQQADNQAASQNPAQPTRQIAAAPNAPRHFSPVHRGGAGFRGRSFIARRG